MSASRLLIRDMRLRCARRRGADRGAVLPDRGTLVAFAIGRTLRCCPGSARRSYGSARFCELLRLAADRPDHEDGSLDLLLMARVRSNCVAVKRSRTG